VKKKLSSGLLVGLLLMAAFGAAALVNYLSNTITYNATVASPITVTVTSPADGNFGTIYGGDTRSVEYNTTNHANNPVSGRHVLVIYGPSDLNGTELDEIKFTYDGTTYTLSDGDIVINATQDVDEDGDKDLIITTPEINHAAGSTDVATKFEITFNAAIQPGDYSFDVKVVP